MKIIRGISIALATLSVSLTSAAQIVLNSDAGDYIGGGKEYDLSEPFNVSISTARIYITHSSGFDFEFVPPNNTELSRGVYLDAERAPFRGPKNPGMEVTSSGRGCNTISGEFSIHEFDVSGETPSLAMDFIQYCDSNTSKLTGTIRLNTDVAIPASSPLIKVTLSDAIPVEGDTITLDASQSVVMTPPYTVSWEQVSGPEANISEPNSVSTNVTMPIGLDLGGANLIFEATVTDAGGNADTTKITLPVSSKSDPKTYFTFESEEGDYIGAGRTWYYDKTNANFNISENHSNGVNVNINGSEYWRAEFAAPDKADLTVGTYDQAERYPFQSAGIAGLTISGDGRGCNESYGAFEVLQLVKDDSGNPESFKATFQQRCSNRTAGLSGEIAVNTPHPSVPVADAGDDIEVFEGQIVNLNGSNSSDDSGQIETYLWSNPNDIVISNSDESRASFVAPNLADRALNQTVILQLDISDSEGYLARDTVQVRILSDNSNPVAANDTFTVVYNEVTNLNVLANDSDEDGSVKQDTILINQQPENGTAVVRSSGLIEYTANQEGEVSDSFTYTVQDNDAGVSNVATVTIQIGSSRSEPDDSENPVDPDEELIEAGSVNIAFLLLILLAAFRGSVIRSK